jgi:ABC-type iron transport system FetAB permease component
MTNHAPQPSSQSPEWEIALLTFVILISIFLGVGYVISLSLAIPIPWLAILIVAGLLTGALYTARQRRRRPIE